MDKPSYKTCASYAECQNISSDYEYCLCYEKEEEKK